MVDWKFLIDNWDKLTDIQKEIIKERFKEIEAKKKLLDFLKKNPDAAKVYELAFGKKPPEFIITSDIIEQLLRVFKERLILRGFSERFAEREAKIRKDEIIGEASLARNLDEAIKLVETYAERYSRMYPRVPRPKPPPEIEVPTIPIVPIMEVESRCPIDMKVMDRVKHLEEKGVVYEILPQFRVYWCEEHGYYVWDERESRHRVVSKSEIINTMSTIMEVRPPPKMKGWIYRMYKTLKMKPEDIAKEFDIPVEFVNETIEEGEKGLVEEGILPPAEEFRAWKRRGFIER